MTRAKRPLAALLSIIMLLSTVMTVFPTTVFAVQGQYTVDNYPKQEVGSKTLSEVLGFDGADYIKYLEKHEDDKYYLGTPYEGGDNRNPNGDCSGAYGINDTPGKAAMNCTGFVWHVLYEVTKAAGKSTDEIPVMEWTGNGWRDFYWNKDIKRRYFASKQEMLESGYLSKGDIIWSIDGGDEVGGGNHHVGIYWGDEQEDGSDGDLYWHSIDGKSDGNGLKIDGNQISKIVPKKPSTSPLWIVLKMNSTQVVSIRKVSANAKLTSGNDLYSLKGATYGVYKRADNQEVAQIVCKDEDGTFDPIELEPDRYYLLEKTAPKGYALDTTKHYFTIGTKNVSIKLTDIPQNDPADILLSKYDGEKTYSGQSNLPQGAATLADAEFTVKYYDGQYSNTDQLKGKEPLRTWIFKTNENGYISLQNKNSYVRGDALFTSSNGDPALPLGTISIQETKAPKGYKLNNEVFVRQITSTGNVESVETYNAPEIPDSVIRGGVEVHKVDAETNAQTPQGDATLENATFAIISRNKNPVTVDGHEYQENETVMTITTENSVAKTANNALPYGSYTVEEITPPNGYAKEGRLTQDFSITTDGAMVVLSGNKSIADNPIRGGVRIQKRDAETREAEPQGNATLEGAVFEITNESDKPVVVNGITYQVGDVVTTITTKGEKDNYVAETAEDALPYGTYKITEVTPPTGYQHKGTLERTFEIRSAGYVDMTTDDNAIYNLPIRGDLEFIKIEDGTMNRLSNVPFKITSKTTGDSHIIVTDENGYASTSAEWNPHSQNTNAGKLSTDGVWFGDSDLVDDNVGALPYDTYIIDEQPCDANKGKELISGVEITISRNNHVVNMGTITNDKIVVEVGTVAADAITGGHEGDAAESITIIDKVQYSGVTPGATYTVEGRIMDKETRSPYLVDGKEVTASIPFTPTAKEGTVDVEFTFDGTGVGGKTLVVFETVYQDGVELGKHEDIDDSRQSVYYYEKPEIGTSASDVLTGDHDGIIRDSITLKDVVSYENLKVGKEYTVTGTLMNKETGEVLIVNEEPVTATTTFTPEHSNGTVELEFTFDGSVLADGDSIVAFESLEQNDREVAVHADLDDAEQTVTFRKLNIQTAAADILTDSHDGMVRDEITIRDNVYFENLRLGTRYTITGTLMDKETGEALLIDGKEVTAKKDFLPEDATEITASDDVYASGYVSVDFTFKGVDELHDKDVVVFETLLQKNVELATHADLEDAEQTVTFKKPDLHTTASDELTDGHDGLERESVILKDVVEYTDLIPGKQYTVTGKLMDKETGKPFVVDGKEVTSTAVFTPELPETDEEEPVDSRVSGTVELEFVFSGKGIGGKTLVAFETLSFDDVELAVHADLEDEEQTVTFEKPEIGTTATNSDDGSHTVSAEEEAHITDTVEYQGLVPGLEYVVTGTLMVKEGGGPLLADGKEVTAEATFTPDEADGSVDVDFTFDASKLGDKNVVVFEKLTLNGTEIANHENINDEGQTVNVKPIPGTISVNGHDKPGTPGGTQTGDTGFKFLIPAIIAGSVALAGAGVATIFVIRKRKTKA